VALDSTEITEDDLGVVCRMVVLAPADAAERRKRNGFA
jgi:hypothetical protein